MNYIRTKNKIYEVESEFLDNEGKWVGYNIIEDDMALILRSQVISQADTIEELCDCFYGEFENGAKIILEKWNGNKFVIWWATNMVSMIKDLNKTYKNVKGAIWTDKGLIYVAKMNSKGEWELL